MLVIIVIRFVVLASNSVHMYYYMDQAGRLPETQEMLTLPSGEMVRLKRDVLTMIMMTLVRWSPPPPPGA